MTRINLDELAIRNPPWHPSLQVGIARITGVSLDRKQRRQEQSLAVRMLLDRILLNCHGVTAPHHYTLFKKPNGQPYLMGKNAPAVTLTHSHNYVACSIAWNTVVGIDIEVIKPRDWQRYQKILHPDELAWIQEGQKSEQDIRGLRCWCAKEAIIKAFGENLADRFAQICLTPHDTFTHLPPILGCPTTWHVTTTVLENTAVLAVTSRKIHP
ncbi:MAG: 4'-phosphopantetheinyl transferase superfamily protein [Ottowia sp.]|nr:4'-phosphopantetheinyl transferase superfamily protein [Ottowia sp.]